jgi:hypothetical protein
MEKDKAHSLVSILLTTHLFEEPGTLAEVTKISLKWFNEHLNASR